MYTLSSANVDTCLGVSRGVIPPPQAGVAAPGDRPGRGAAGARTVAGRPALASRRFTAT